jgi:hypothetical protein
MEVSMPMDWKPPAAMRTLRFCSSFSEKEGSSMAGFIFPVDAFAVSAVGVSGAGGGAQYFFFAGYAADLWIEVVSGDVADGFFVQHGIGVAEDEDLVTGVSDCAVDCGGLSCSWGLVEELDGWKAGDDGGGLVCGAVGDEDKFYRFCGVVQFEGVGDLVGDDAGFVIGCHDEGHGGLIICGGGEGFVFACQAGV